MWGGEGEGGRTRNSAIGEEIAKGGGADTLCINANYIGYSVNLELDFCGLLN